MDTRMDLRSYAESLIGGLSDDREIRAELREMQEAKVGYIKANCWEKVGEDEYIIYSM